jgi:hypothetical protein
VVGGARLQLLDDLRRVEPQVGEHDHHRRIQRRRRHRRALARLLDAVADRLQRLLPLHVERLARAERDGARLRHGHAHHAGAEEAVLRHLALDEDDGEAREEAARKLGALQLEPYAAVLVLEAQLAVLAVREHAQHDARACHAGRGDAVAARRDELRGRAWRAPLRPMSASIEVSCRYARSDAPCLKRGALNCSLRFTRCSISARRSASIAWRALASACSCAFPFADTNAFRTCGAVRAEGQCGHQVTVLHIA